MQDPSALYRFETDTDPQELRASVLHLALSGFVDAGGTQRMATDHILATLEHSVVASFDLDALLDYRGRRPAMTFDRDRWAGFADPTLVLYRVVDADGVPFLLLTGLEPDYQWERFAEAVRRLAVLLGVALVISANGIPMAVPHTRPVGVTPYASSPRLIGDHEAVFGRVQVPGSAEALLHVRLAEAGLDTGGFAVHVPHYLSEGEFGDAAVAGLQAVNGVTGLRIPMAELMASAGLNRAEIVREVTGSLEASEVVEQLEKQYDTFVEGRRRRSLLATEVGELPTPDELGAEFEEFLRDAAETRRNGQGGTNEQDGSRSDEH